MNKIERTIKKVKDNIEAIVSERNKVISTKVDKLNEFIQEAQKLQNEIKELERQNVLEIKTQAVLQVDCAFRDNVCDYEDGYSCNAYLIDEGLYVDRLDFEVYNKQS